MKADKKFDGAMQLQIEHGCGNGTRVTVNCPDEDDEIYIQIRKRTYNGFRYSDYSLTLDEAERLAKYILGHVKNARIANP